MALGPLWLGLTLLGALQTPVQAPPPPQVPLLLRVLPQPNFQQKKFQGKWYVLSETNSSEKKEAVMYHTITYQLVKNHIYKVYSFQKRNNSCEAWTRNFIQHGTVGQFTLESLVGLELKRYETRVVDSDYESFALVLHISSWETGQMVRASLYGRENLLTPELKDKFLHFFSSLGLTNSHAAFIPSATSRPPSGSTSSSLACY